MPAPHYVVFFISIYCMSSVSTKEPLTFWYLYFWRALYVVIDSVPSLLPFFITDDDGVEMSKDVFPQQVKIKQLL